MLRENEAVHIEYDYKRNVARVYFDLEETIPIICGTELPSDNGLITDLLLRKTKLTTRKIGNEEVECVLAIYDKI